MKKNFDLKKTVVLVCHCQNDIIDPKGKFNYSGMYKQVNKHDILNRIAEVLKVTRKAKVPVIYINNVYRKGYPELGIETVPILAGARAAGSVMSGTWGVQNPDKIKPEEDDLVMENYNTSAFSYTNLDQILRAKEIRMLILLGTATNFVIDSTARYGSELGYEIVVVEDCCASFNDEMHQMEIKYNLPQYAEITDRADIIAQMTK